MRVVAFLRGINVSGQKIIKMDFLKTLFEKQGYQNVVTYIQSGNVAFDATEPDEDKIRQHVESLIKEGTGFDVVTVIRNMEAIKKVIAANPFHNDMREETHKLYVHFLSAVPADNSVDLLLPALNPEERAEIVNQELYFLTPSFGNTKLSNVFIERKLKCAATARNWATTNKMITL